MAGRIWTQSGVLLSGTGTGVRTVTGLPDKPRLVLFTTDLQTATGFGGTAHFGYGWGAEQDDGTVAQACFQASGADAVATWETRRTQQQLTTPRCIFVWDTPGAVHLLEASFVSCDANGFAINVVANNTNDQRIYWFALGGRSILNVKGGQMVMTASAAPVDQTDSSLTFEPDLLLFLFARRATDGSTTQIEHSFGMGGKGAATPPQWAIGMAANTGTTSLFASCRQQSDSIIVAPSPSSSVGAMECQVQLKNTASNGFTVTWVTKTATASALLSWLAIKGPLIKLAAVNKTTSAAPVDQDISAPGFVVRGVMLASFGALTSTSGVLDGRNSFGFSDGTNHGATWVWHTSGGTSVAKRSNIDTKAIRLATAPSTTDAEASVDLTAVVGGFRLTWSTNNAVANELLYTAIGETSTVPIFRGA